MRLETVDKLNILSNGNRFWRMRANSKDKWDGNKEAAALLVPVIAGVFYYLFFVINAGKITDKAIDIFYRNLSRS